MCHWVLIVKRTESLTDISEAQAEGEVDGGVTRKSQADQVAEIPLDMTRIEQIGLTRFEQITKRHLLLFQTYRRSHQSKWTVDDGEAKLG
jgi:hypothetical protein